MGALVNIWLQGVSGSGLVYQKLSSLDILVIDDVSPGDTALEVARLMKSQSSVHLMLREIHYPSGEYSVFLP